MLRRTLGADIGQSVITPIGDYVELVWYDAAEQPDIDLLQSDMRSWMNSAIQELLDIIIAAQQAV